jgi:hypothetical protein
LTDSGGLAGFPRSSTHFAQFSSWHYAMHTAHAVFVATAADARETFNGMEIER